MGLFGGKKPYDRARLLSEAARLQRKGKSKKAVAAYREILAMEPGNLDVHRRIAPLLARTREKAEAFQSYRRAADGLVKQGFVERAIGVYREASRLLPREDGVWLALAELEAGRGRRADALAALLAGRRQLRRRAERPRALKLLERARVLDPAAFEPNFELAALLARDGQRARARIVLEGLAAKAQGRTLRRVRARQLYLAPSPRSAWRYLRALTGVRR
jgi:Tfp pilus assembly protein PilF